MNYTETYFVQAHKGRQWVNLSEHESEYEAVMELDYQYDIAVREDRPAALRVIRQSEVTIYTRSKA